MTDQDADDAALIDRLYAGSDESGLQVVRGLVARVREEMPGVEPPPALSARLLQAATPVREGVWSRLRTWFAGIAMHPGLAAAATLVVVAGATAIWMRQGGKAATPTVSSTPAPVAQQDPPMLDEEVEGRGMTESSPVQVQRETVAADKDVRPPDKPASRPEKKVASKPVPQKQPGGVPAGTGEATGASGTGDSTPDVVTETPVVTTKVGGKQAEDKPTSTQPPPPPADDPVAPSQPTTDSDDDEPNGAPSDAELARQLTRQATTAAKKGDCKTVDYLAKKVRGLDNDYYNNGFIPQPDIASCRAAKKK